MRLQDTRAMSEKNINTKQGKDNMKRKKNIFGCMAKHNVNTFTINGNFGCSTVLDGGCQH